MYVELSGILSIAVLSLKVFFKNPFTFFSLCCCVEFKGFFFQKNPFTFFPLCCCVEFNFFSSRKLSLSFHCMAVLSLGDVRTSNISTTSDFHGSVVYEV